MSLHLLGAEVGKAILIRVNNPLDMASSQGGATGAIAAWAVPKYTTSMVLDKMVDQFKTSLAGAGVKADVLVIDDTGVIPAKSNKDLMTGTVLGAILVGAGWAAWRFGIKRFFFKSAS